MTAGRKKHVAPDDRGRIASLYGKTMPADRIELMARALLTIRRRRGITVEELSEHLGTDYGTTSVITGILESDGLISIDLLQRCCINIVRQDILSE